MSKKLLVMVAALVLGAMSARAANRTYGAYLLNDPTLAYSTNPAVDLTAVDNLAFQLTWASATVAAFSFDDGLPGTGTFTVSKPTQMLTSPATAQITISSNSALSNAVITINGTAFTEGASRQWLKATTASGTAVSLAAALDASSDFDASASSNVVYATATNSGTFANSWTLTSSTPAALSVITWRGGRDNLILSVNGISFQAGTSFTPVTTASGTAKAISDFMMGYAPISGIISSTWSAAGVVTATAAATGSASNYTLTSSSAAIAAAAGMTNGSASEISVANDTIALTDHKISTGFPMWWGTTSGTAPTGLTTGTTYYAIKVDANTIKLSTTSALARAGTAVDITATVGRSAFTLNPTAFTGTWTLSWQASNDNTNWYSLTATSSPTYSTPNTVMWDGPINYRYLRAVFTGGTGGGMNIKLLGNGKQFQ